MKRCLMLVVFVLTCGAPIVVHAQTAAPPKPAAQDEFVPVNAPINAQDTIPAPRLVAIAYGFIWVVLLGYVWSVRSRLATVERELQTVSKRVGSGGRPA
jgi:CcmD family protein